MMSLTNTLLSVASQLRSRISCLMVASRLGDLGHAQSTFGDTPPRLAFRCNDRRPAELASLLVPGGVLRDPFGRVCAALFRLTALPSQPVRNARSALRLSSQPRSRAARLGLQWTQSPPQGR